jgi:hypothetical protein
MKIEQKYNFPVIQELSDRKVDQNQRNKSTEATRDVFESRIDSKKESALFKHEKAEADYYKGNVENMTLDSNLPSVHDIRHNLRLPIKSKESETADEQNATYANSKESFKRAIKVITEHEERTKQATGRV